jgi:hypothetical protein
MSRRRQAVFGGRGKRNLPVPELITGAGVHTLSTRSMAQTLEQLAMQREQLESELRQLLDSRPGPGWNAKRMTLLRQVDDLRMHIAAGEAGNL